MADLTAQGLDPMELAQLAKIEKDNSALEALIGDLDASSRRTRQFSAHVVLLLAQREPELLVPYIGAMIDALDCSEAQTRWELLDALTTLVGDHADQMDGAYDGAEAALFDELSATLRLAAFRMLCAWGATAQNRSQKVWPIIDEAIQCYHGDLEYRDMLGCLYDFATGEIAADVASALAARLHFDAENGKGSYLKARSREISDVLVERFKLEPPKKKARAKKASADNEEE